MWNYLLDKPDKNINLLDLFDDFDSILDRSTSIFSSSLQDLYGMNVRQKTRGIYLSALRTAYEDLEIIQKELRDLEKLKVPKKLQGVCKDYIEYANQTLDLFNDHYANAESVFSALTSLTNISLISDSMFYILDFNNTESIVAIGKQIDSHIIALRNSLSQLKYRSTNMQAFVKDSLETVEQLSELKSLYIEAIETDAPTSSIISGRFGDLLYEFDPAIYFRADLISTDGSQFKLVSRIRNLRLKEIYSK